MSVKVTSWVWQHSPASGTELLLLLALADQSDDHGKCWPSMAYIADKMRVHEDTAKRAMKRVVDAGLVIRELRDGKSNIFRLIMSNPPAIHPPADRTPPQDTGGQSAPQPPRNAPPDPPADDPPRTIKEPSKNREGRPRRAPARIAEDWAPSPALIEWTRKNYPNMGWKEVEHFRDHWLAAGGPNALKRDWDAAWRTWCRKSPEFTGSRATSFSGRKTSHDDRANPASVPPPQFDPAAERLAGRSAS